MKRKCKVCDKDKLEDDFYNNGYKVCKDCVRQRVREREEKLRKDPKWVEREKSRHRDKYHRLNYKDKHKPTPEEKKKLIDKYWAKFPEKRKAHISSQRIIKKGFEKHHWSYNKEHFKDLFWFNTKQHNYIHRYLVYDQEFKMYRTFDGELLDTREKHELFIYKLF